MGYLEELRRIKMLTDDFLRFCEEYQEGIIEDCDEELVEDLHRVYRKDITEARERLEKALPSILSSK